MEQALAAWLMVAAVVAAPVATPREVIQSAVTRVVALVQDGDPRGDTTAHARGARDAARAEIRRIAAETFDVDEMARRALSRHWAVRTPAEQVEFVRLFTDLLERAYIGKIEAYAGDRIVYLGSAIDGDYATVRTKIARNTRADIAFDYRLHLTEGRWKVYDLLLDGVSFVSTYRAEFNRVIQASSYEELVARLRKREVVAERL